VAADHHAEPIDLAAIEIPDEVIEMVPSAVAQIYRVMPIRFDKASNTLTFAMVDPENLSILDDLRFLFGCRIDHVPGTEEAVAEVIARHYPDDLAGDLQRIADDFEAGGQGPSRAAKVTNALTRACRWARTGVAHLMGRKTVLSEEIDDSPEIRFVSCLFAFAVRDAADEVVLAPRGEGYAVSFVTEPGAPPLATISRRLGASCLERLKQMANIAGPHAPSPPPSRGVIRITLSGTRLLGYVAVSEGPDGEGARLSIERPAVAHIGIGSSVDPEKNIPAALIRMWEDYEGVVSGGVSSFWRTGAIGRPDAPDSYNCVAELWTTLGARELKFKVLRKIEAELGRVRTDDSYAPRTIDLDLLLYGDLVVDEPDLKLPDPDILERPWLAAGLLELEPELVMPDTAKPLAGLVPPEARAGLEPVRIFTEKVWERLRHERETRR